jgi:hypothetical protein
MSGLIDPPKTVTETFTITRYFYELNNIKLHTSVEYVIVCFNGDTLVKTISGLLEGEQYKEWTTDDWLDAFIKAKVENL